MAKKNLFEYANKELSQDAFLCWLFQNHNDDNVGPFALDFINFLTGFNIDFKVNRIAELTTKQQANSMDVVVDFWINEREDQNHYVFVIEDKTRSSEHDNQLKRYQEIAYEWNEKEEGHEKRLALVYYKTDFPSLEERALMENKDLKWKAFFIEEIYNHFKDIKEQKSEILNDYVARVKSIYEKLTKGPSANSNPENWDLMEAKTYFVKTLFGDQKEDEVRKHTYYEKGSYLGRYAFLRVYYVLQNEKFVDEAEPEPKMEQYKNRCTPLVEYIFRPNTDKVIVYTHVSYKKYNKKEKNRHWFWKKAEYCRDIDDPSVTIQADKDFAENANNLLKGLLKEKGLKCWPMQSDRSQTISTESFNKSDINKEQFLQNSLKKYLDIFKEMDKKE